MRYMLDDMQTSCVNYRLSFQPIVNGPVALTFSSPGDDLGGAILDNVAIERRTVAAPAPGALFDLAFMVGAVFVRQSR